MLKEQDGCPCRPIPLLGIDSAFQLPRDLVQKDCAARAMRRIWEARATGTAALCRRLFASIKAWLAIARRVKKFMYIPL
jgi:hypothetical protein